MIWRAPAIWDGGECFIIGGGESMPRQFGVPEDIIAKVTSGEARPSAYSSCLSPIHDRHVIGVNNAYMLGTWLDAVFFGDCAWYNVHRLKLAEWPNLKVTCCNRFENRPPQSMEGIKYLKKDSGHRQGISRDRRKVSWNSNSGAAAISLACHFGVRRIILLGFDMNLGWGGASHWHRGHGNKRQPFKKHLRGFPTIADDARALGVEILNANPRSAIDAFPKVELKEVLNDSG